jgi:hypothetical protein
MIFMLIGLSLPAGSGRILKNLCESVSRRIIPIRQLTERNLSLETKDLRDSWSSANKNGGLLGMTGEVGFSASCWGWPLFHSGGHPNRQCCDPSARRPNAVLLLGALANMRSLIERLGRDPLPNVVVSSAATIPPEQRRMRKS